MSEEKLPPQYAQVEQPAMVDYPIIYCPICGTPPITMVEVSAEHTYCQHLSFIYISDEFTYKSDEFEQKIRDVKDVENDNMDENEYFDESTQVKKYLMNKLIGAGYDNIVTACPLHPLFA